MAILRETRLTGKKGSDGTGRLLQGEMEEDEMGGIVQAVAAEILAEDAASVPEHRGAMLDDCDNDRSIEESETEESTWDERDERGPAED